MYVDSCNLKKGGGSFCALNEGFLIIFHPSLVSFQSPLRDRFIYLIFQHLQKVFPRCAVAVLLDHFFHLSIYGVPSLIFHHSPIGFLPLFEFKVFNYMAAFVYIKDSNSSEYFVSGVGVNLKPFDKTLISSLDRHIFE